MDAHHRQQLGPGPTSQRFGVREDQREADEPGAQPNE
jgi:hypothetical protein